MSWKCPKCSADNQDPDTGEYLLLRIKTAVGETLCKKLAPDSQFWAEPQFTCEPASDGWRIIPNTEAPNETQLNGRAITSTQIVGTGDILSVGKESKGIIKLPLQVNPAIAGTQCTNCRHFPFLILKSVSTEDAERIMAEESTPRERQKVLDIVFLIDVTQSMRPALEALKKNISVFVDSLKTKWRANRAPDWRAKVVGYRDFTDDTAPPLEDNPFVHNDADALKSQLQALQVQGEDKGPSSLLDAIHIVANMGQSERGTEELDRSKWRYRNYSSERHVIVFTGATYHPTTKDGGTCDDIHLSCSSNRILLSIFAPELPCYDQLASIDRSEYEAIEIEGSESPVQALARYMQDTEAFKQVMKILIEGILQRDIEADASDFEF